MTIEQIDALELCLIVFLFVSTKVFIHVPMCLDNALGYTLEHYWKRVLLKMLWIPTVALSFQLVGTTNEYLLTVCRMLILMCTFSGCCQVDFRKDDQEALNEFISLITRNSTALFDGNDVLMGYGPESVGTAEIIRDVKVRDRSDRPTFLRNDLESWPLSIEEV